MATAKLKTKLEMQKVKELLDDPVKWAQIFINIFDNTTKQKQPWIARWYQSEMLQDKSIKKVYRCGRRTGKCITGDTQIIDPNTGELHTVEELYNKKRAYIGTMTEDYKIEKHFTNQILDNGIKEVFEITTQNGRKIKATGNHPFFTIDGWKEIDDLVVGDAVAIANNTQFFGNNTLPEEEIKLLAYMIGDGNCTTKTTRFASINEKHIEEMKQICDYFKCELKQYHYDVGTANFNIVKKENKANRMFRNGVIVVLEKHNTASKGAFEKEIPKEIFKLKKEQIALFLNRLYATDGWACLSDTPNRPNDRKQIGYCSVNRKLVEQIQHLLLRFGINSSLEIKKSSYTLSIYDSINCEKFCKEIGIYGKEEAVKKVYDMCQKGARPEPYYPKKIINRVLDLATEQGLYKKDLCIEKNERVRNYYDIQKSKLKQYAYILKDEDLINLSESDILFEKIKEIKSLGEMQTYDLSVPITQNFIANDFITHNTETMIIDMLHKACTKNHYRILVVTPYENQVRLIFMRLNEIISESPLIASTVIRNTKNPYIYEFANGSAILGFTTGAASGSGGASIRGQKADCIYMDEVDYMGESDFDSVMAIAGERPDIGVIMSSTPTGRRGHFYYSCLDPARGFQEHFHPSTHNPNWCAKMEAEFRAILSEQGYVHEIMAEFGTQDTGVFNKDKVDASMKVLRYAYNPLDYYQEERVKHEKEHGGEDVRMMLYDLENPAPHNPLRTVGVNTEYLLIIQHIL